MKLNSRVTGGLAWTGLILILGVPSAEVLTNGTILRADTAVPVEGGAGPAGVDSIETASVTAPVPATRKGVAADPVEAWLATGKELPSYISDAPGATHSVEQAAAAPSPVETPALVVPTGPATAEVAGDGTFAEPDAVQTAAVASDPPLPAPRPYPLALRPAASSASVDSRPLIIDENALARRQVASQSFETLPPPVVDGGELEEWNSGSLEDYLERQGLLGEPEEPVRTYESEFESDYDRDGFFLSDGPNSERRLIGRYEPRLFGLF